MLGTAQNNGIPFWFHPVTWTLVIVGWLIVNWQNNRREDRKEIRAALTKIYSDINDLQQEAINFHTSKRQDFNLESKIVLTQGRLTDHLGHLRIRSSSYFTQLSAFIDAITLENFQDSKFTRQAISSELVDNIRDTANELEAALENEFSQLFRGGFITKTIALYRETKEQIKPIGTALYFLEKWQCGIIILLAYLGFAVFFGYVLHIIPKTH